MKTAHIDDLLSWHPCSDYDEDRIRELAGDAETFTALDVLHREDIPAADRLWVVLRPEMVEETILHEFRCDCAAHVQPEDADPRSLNAIETKRHWIRGEATDDELTAARTAARTATWAADGAAERDWQIARLVHLLGRAHR